MGPHCLNHRERIATASCVACRRGLCDECYEHELGGRPACRACAFEVATRSQRGLSLAISIAGLGGGLLFVAARRQWVASPMAIAGLAVLLGLVALTAGLAMRRETPEVAKRDRGPSEAPPSAHGDPWAGNPFRQRARNLTARMTPRVSGAMTAAALGASLLGAAVMFPAALDLPHWIEAEVVLAFWWLVLALALSILLHRGTRVRDDYLLVGFWNRPPSKEVWRGQGDTKSKSSPLDWLGCGDGCTSVDGEAFVWLIVLVVVAFALAGALWILAEMAVPILLFLGYAIITRALARVAHDTHGCRGELLRSIGWGALWSTIYVTPLAVVVLVIHGALAHK